MSAADLKRRMAIVRIADRLLHRAGVDQAPVSTDLIHGEHPHIRVLPAELGAATSSLRVICSPEGEETQALIHINMRQGIPRQRFSIAHEYGHYLLHHLGWADSSAPAPTGSRGREQEADLFASSLLVPLWLLDRQCPAIRYEKPHQEELERLTLKLASLFNVSRSCMGRAVYQLYHMRRALAGQGGS